MSQDGVQRSTVLREVDGGCDLLDDTGNEERRETHHKALPIYIITISVCLSV
jgi:hypothetical protein